MTNFTKRGRLIIINGFSWRWKVGKGGHVLAYSEKGKRMLGKAWEIKGISCDSFERGQWKGTSDGMLFPSEIEKWLSNESK
jgi:hypothetical protein